MELRGGALLGLSCAIPVGMINNASLLSLTTELAAWASWDVLGESSSRPTNEVRRQALPHVAAGLVVVKTPDELELALEKALSDPSVASAVLIIVRASVEADVGFPDPFTVAPEVRRLIGQPAAQTLESGAAVLRQQVDLLPQLWAHADAGERDRAWEVLEQQGSLDALLTRDWHPEIIGHTLKAIVGTLSLYALELATSRREVLPEWLGLVFADNVVSGARAYVRCFGGMPGVKLDPSVDVLNLEALTREYQEGRWGLELTRLGHVASGADVTFPFGGGVDED